MPATASSRQPGSSHWFSGRPGRLLLEQERQWLQARLASRPSQPRLWLCPHAPETAGAEAGVRQLGLYPHGAGYAGSLHCGLPLPLASECLGDVILQHPPPAQAEAWVEEGARILVEGGRLWLCVFNPFSPYRLRGSGGPWRVPLHGHWQAGLARQGLQLLAVQALGPAWRVRPAGSAPGPLRAAWVFVAEKRMGSWVSPAPLQWRRGAAPAA